MLLLEQARRNLSDLHTCYGTYLLIQFQQRQAAVILIYMEYGQAVAVLVSGNQKIS